MVDEDVWPQRLRLPDRIRCLLSLAGRRQGQVALVPPRPDLQRRPRMYNRHHYDHHHHIIIITISSSSPYHHHHHIIIIIIITISSSSSSSSSSNALVMINVRLWFGHMNRLTDQTTANSTVDGRHDRGRHKKN